MCAALLPTDCLSPRQGLVTQSAALRPFAPWTGALVLSWTPVSAGLLHGPLDSQSFFYVFFYFIIDTITDVPPPTPFGHLPDSQI